MAATQELILHLADEEATVAAGEALGRACLAQGLNQGLNQGLVIFLHGQLGAGKTTLCRGVLRAFGHGGAVKSPTYTLVEPYEFSTNNGGAQRVYHFDLYRLGDAEELEYMGVRDYFGSHSLSLVEWPQRGAGVLPQADLSASLQLAGSGRELSLQAQTEAGAAVAGMLRKLL